MSGFSGKLTELKIGTGGTAVRVAALKTTSMSVDGTQVDTSNQDDGAWGSTLTGGGKKSCSIEVKGLTKGTAAQNAFLLSCSNQDSVEYTLAFPFGLTAVGNFIANGFKIDSNVDGAIEFSTTLQNDGEVTFTVTP